jgi:hypothetical protein
VTVENPTDFGLGPAEIGVLSILESWYKTSAMQTGNSVASVLTHRFKVALVIEGAA